jgi:hypothetical protein
MPRTHFGLFLDRPEEMPALGVAALSAVPADRHISVEDRLGGCRRGQRAFGRGSLSHIEELSHLHTES